MGTGQAPNSSLVEVRSLTKSYGRITAIRDVSFSVRAGEVLGLIGPNGAGKTTLFECLAGVQPFDSGSVSFSASGAGQSRASTLFYVPDGIAPWPQQSVAWGLEFTLGFWSGRGALFDDVVRELGLGSLLSTRIGARERCPQPACGL